MLASLDDTATNDHDHDDEGMLQKSADLEENKCWSDQSCKGKGHSPSHYNPASNDMDWFLLLTLRDFKSDFVSPTDCTMEGGSEYRYVQRYSQSL